jgi:hypothetical protein
MEEFVACGMHSLATSVGFDNMATLVTPVLKLKVPLWKFVAVHKDVEDDVQFLARVELDTEGIIGSYTRPEHEACVASLRNGGRLNMVFELADVAYGPRSDPGTEEFIEALKKRKMDAARKNLSKHARALRKKEVETVKAAMPLGKTCTPQGKGVVPRGNGGLKRPSGVEVASARTVKQTKKTIFRLIASATVAGTVAGHLGLRLRPAKKDCDAYSEAPHFCYRCYGRGILNRITGVIASRFGGLRLASGQRVDVGASRFLLGPHCPMWRLGRS